MVKRLDPLRKVKASGIRLISFRGACGRWLLIEGLRILIVTPAYLPDVTGNSITAHRLYKGLRGKGVRVQVIVGAYRDAPDFRPDIIHALHARKGGIPALKLAEQFGVPLVVTITGTDLNIDLQEGRSEDVLNVLSWADRIIVYSRITKDRLLAQFPALANKVVIIKPSVEIRQLEKRVKEGSGFDFLLPSGIRRVKAPSFAIRPLEVLRKEFPLITLSIAGPILDEEEWNRLSDGMKGRGWIKHQIVSHDEMADIYGAADIVLNTSISEGLSNAILEAMYLGKPVVASDCEGNRAAISNGVDGLLYRQGNKEDFRLKARTLIFDPAMRKRLGAAARGKVVREYGLDAEIEGHIKLYRELLSEKG